MNMSREREGRGKERRKEEEQSVARQKEKKTIYKAKVLVSTCISYGIISSLSHPTSIRSVLDS